MSSSAIIYGNVLPASDRDELEKKYAASNARLSVLTVPAVPETVEDATCVIVDLDNPQFIDPAFLVALTEKVGVHGVTGATRNPDLDLARFARQGVSQVISPERCLLRLHELLEQLASASSGSTQAPHGPDLQAIVGSSAWMRELHDIVHALSEVDFPMALILGETGTGKSLVAKVLHYSGLRRQNHLVEVNCSAIPDELFESELFGYARGAFTDAKAEKPGLFEFANLGTIFLDEVGNLSSSAQAKLLKVLEDRRVRRVGEVEDRPVNVRVLAATHRDLQEAVAEGSFREDLFYRLNLLSITVPPLRDRPEDIHALASHYVRHFGTNYAKPNLRITEAAVSRLRRYHWPGNVRELCNVIERAVLLDSKGAIDADDIELGPEISAPLRGDHLQIRIEVPPDGVALKSIEFAVVKQVLDRLGGNRSKAAACLKISRPRLRRILNSGSLERDDPDS